MHVILLNNVHLLNIIFGLNVLFQACNPTEQCAIFDQVLYIVRQISQLHGHTQVYVYLLNTTQLILYIWCRLDTNEASNMKGIFSATHKTSYQS